MRARRWCLTSGVVLTLMGVPAGMTSASVQPPGSADAPLRVVTSDGTAPSGDGPAWSASGSAGSEQPAVGQRMPQRPAVLSKRIIGKSVNDHPIRAWELGDRSADLTVVAVADMHGNETGGEVILNQLRDGRAISDVHLWVIPRDNPDGVLRQQRHNAHAVDLNRNFGVKWKPLTGYYYAGPRPWSEPETRILRRFLNDVDPDYVVSFHSPLFGVDAYGAKDRPFAWRLAHEMALPIKEFDCAGVCHGTLTQWFNARHDGACVTVELAADPGDRYLHRRGPRGLLRAIGGHR